MTCSSFSLSNLKITQSNPVFFLFCNIFQLVTHENTRNDALDTMNKALDSYVIRGMLSE